MAEPAPALPASVRLLKGRPTRIELAVTSKKQGNFLYAADLFNNKIDMYDSTFKFVKSFTDPKIPKSFSTFNIQDINGLLYVAYASPTGGAGGFIDIFKEDGTFVKRFAHGAPLNQPWGFAVAPKNFGPLSNERKKAYNDAKLFLQQAEEALKQGNFAFAQGVATKAETLARELAGR